MAPPRVAQEIRPDHTAQPGRLSSDQPHSLCNETAVGALAGDTLKRAVKRPSTWTRNRIHSQSRQRGARMWVVVSGGRVSPSRSGGVVWVRPRWAHALVVRPASTHQRGIVRGVHPPSMGVQRLP